MSKEIALSLSSSVFYIVRFPQIAQCLENCSKFGFYNNKIQDQPGVLVKARPAGVGRGVSWDVLPREKNLDHQPKRNCCTLTVWSLFLHQQVTCIWVQDRGTAALKSNCLRDPGPALRLGPATHLSVPQFLHLHHGATVSGDATHLIGLH